MVKIIGKPQEKHGKMEHMYYFQVIENGGIDIVSMWFNRDDTGIILGY